MNFNQNKKAFKTALMCAGATVGYIAGIASFMFYIEHIFDNTKPDTIFAPIFMLTLFVLSAAVVGFAVFGVPILWYMDGEKKEALHLLGYTLALLLVALMILAIINIM